MPEITHRINLLGCCLLAAVVLLAGCAGHNRAPVKDLERPQKVSSGSHVVRPGDTLYSIAWRYGWDYKALARANRIGAPYLLKPGQVIYLSERRRPQPMVAKKQAEIPRHAPLAAKKPKVQSAPAPGPLQWQWPLQGTVVGKFASWDHNKGVDIAAANGSAVQAAAPGSVVYAGNGLIGYGNLIIIKHNEVYLSAYAHNKKILVAEKKNVKAGEKIAEIGATRGSNAVLHFEIRKRGKSVDPLDYLPTERNK